MLTLSPGEYSGKVVAKQKIDGGIVTAARYSRDDCNCNCNWHSHENMHISFVFQGGGESEGSGASSSKRQDGVFYFNAGEKHRWIPQSGISKSINIELRSDFFDTLNFDAARVGAAINRNIDAKFLMLKMRHELFVLDAASREAIRALLLELVGGSMTTIRVTPPKWVSGVNEILNDRWNMPVSLDDLARAVDVHPVTISKSFRKYFSCTLGEFLRKLKIEKSIGMIKNSNRSLTEIAIFCGFADQSHFTRTFKRVTGFLPKEFRKI